jgi:hypothetical protein
MTKNITFPKATIIDNKLIFDDAGGFFEAIKYGVFFVKIPNHLDMNPGQIFAKSFYKDKDNSVYNAYKGFRNEEFEGSILGYSDRNDQVEQIQLEIALWDKFFPEKLSNLLKEMNNISKLIVLHVFNEIGIQNSYLDKITGGLPNDNGLQYCIFNHYRSDVDQIGITGHQDSGFITVLYSVERGLEALIDENWVSINPENGYFTINLGHSFEILTKKMQKSVKAVFHRVIKTTNKKDNKEDRFSFGTYIGPRFDMNLYQYYEDQKNLVFFKTFKDFQIEKAKQMNYEFHPRVK